MIIMQGEEIIQSLEDLKEYLERNDVFKEHPACEEKISEIIQEIKKNEKEKIEAEILARDGRDSIEEVLNNPPPHSRDFSRELGGFFIFIFIFILLNFIIKSFTFFLQTYLTKLHTYGII